MRMEEIVTVAAAAQPGSAVIAAPARAWRERLVLPHAVVAARSLLGLGIVWYGGSLWVGNTILLPSPLRVVGAFVGLIASGEMLQHGAISLFRLLVSLGIAVAFAVPLGLVMGLSRVVAELIDPVIELLRPISGIAWIPLALFIFGIGGTLPIFIMSYAAFFPLLLNTIAGVRGVDARLVAAARTMGVRHSAILLHVVVPAAVPTIVVGLRLAVASGWTAIVAAELIGADSGVGFAIEWYRELLMTPKVLAFIVAIGFIGYGADLAIRALQRRLAPWAVTAELA